MKLLAFSYGEHVRLGLESLRLHKLRSFLAMLGMIIGVGAVVSMLSIGAGARQQAMTAIRQLGVRNLIVEASEATDFQALQNTRRQSPGLTFADYRLICANLEGLLESSPRKRFSPVKMIPKPSQEVPPLLGVLPSYERIASLHVVAGRFFNEDDNETAAPVCVLGEGAKLDLFGEREAVGEYLKADDQWLRVIGVVGSQPKLIRTLPGVPGGDASRMIYTPLRTVLLRAEDSRSRLKDEVDGIHLRLADGVDSLAAAQIVRGVLDATHRKAADFRVIVPAELLADERRTRRVFDMVMVALASTSLLVGGIGIMNIMLASVLERTREIGIRRAMGARRQDIVRQFLVEAVLISVMGGSAGTLFGFGLSSAIAAAAGWSTIVTFASILLALVVSASVGLVFGVFPARRAARVDPVEAMRCE